MSAVAWVMFGVAAAGVIAIYAVMAPDTSLLALESPHDRDLRDCRARYAASPYAPADHRAYQAEVVAACMRGRGY